jgi:hypothetical protein
MAQVNSSNNSSETQVNRSKHTSFLESLGRIVNNAAQQVENCLGVFPSQNTDDESVLSFNTTSSVDGSSSEKDDSTISTLDSNRYLLTEKKSSDVSSNTSNYPSDEEFSEIFEKEDEIIVSTLNITKSSADSVSSNHSDYSSIVGAIENRIEDNERVLEKNLNKSEKTIETIEIEHEEGQEQTLYEYSLKHSGSSNKEFSKNSKRGIECPIENHCSSKKKKSLFSKFLEKNKKFKKIGKNIFKIRKKSDNIGADDFSIRTMPETPSPSEEELVDNNQQFCDKRFEESFCNVSITSVGDNDYGSCDLLGFTVCSFSFKTKEENQPPKKEKRFRFPRNQHF